MMLGALSAAVWPSVRQDADGVCVHCELAALCHPGRHTVMVTAQAPPA